MKFDPFQWSEIDYGKDYESPAGRLQVQSTKPTSIFVYAEGHEALASVGTSHDVTFSEAVTYRVYSDVPVRCFVKAPRAIHHRTTGEVFTNLDRMVEESGTLAEVRKALRGFKLEQRDTLQAMRQERAKLERARIAREAAQGATPAPDPEPDTPDQDGQDIDVPPADTDTPAPDKPTKRAKADK